MKPVDTLIFARWIVPVEPHNTYFEHHAIAIDKGKIIEILPSAKASQLYRTTNVHHLDQHVVIPGLINSHTHSPMTLFRGMADDLSLMNWLQNHIWPAEKRWLSDQFCYDGALLAILEMLRSGTTCFNDMYFYLESIGRAAAKAKIRAILGVTILDFPTNYAQTLDEYFIKAEALYETWRHHPLIEMSIAPHAPYTVSDSTFHRVKEFVKKHPVNIQLHLHETAEEVNQGTQQYQMRPLKRIYDLGLMSERLQCVHMTQINHEDIVLLQKSKAHVIHCPQSNLKLASGFCPVKKLMDADVNVALGTDGAASNNDLDMCNEMQTASILAKAVAKDPTALNAANTLRMATLNGARALHKDREIGSLVAGKAADIVAIDLSAINTQPIYNPISHIAYALNSQQVTDVWIAGEQLLRNKKFTLLNETDILGQTQEWNKKLSSTQGEDACL
jgi:5-methylthioadenosine/S-adenosylhomocysteine deaminase